MHTSSRTGAWSGFPGVSRSQQPPVNIGDAVVLETPAGAVHRTVIPGMELVSARYAVRPPPAIPVLTGTEVDKGMVPVGTRGRRSGRVGQSASAWAAGAAPKRRSRRRNSATASARSGAAKSGQAVSVKSSSA